MITIISGTNRADSMSLRVANVYHNMMSDLNVVSQVLSLEGKEVWEKGADMKALEERYLKPVDKFLFIMPEYNASFPGVLKMMMDNCDVKKCWWYKKAALVGISDGRAGNLRGTEHMTAILNYLKVNVLYNKVLLSRIGEEVDKESRILKPQTKELISVQIDEFVRF